MMSNLGAYQTMTRLAKKVGGPKVLAAGTAVVGYLVLRPVEAGARRAVQAVKDRDAPRVAEEMIFHVTADGDDKDLHLREGSEYRVLERDGDAILIEVLGDTNNPYFVSSEFLRAVSDFPMDDPSPGE